MVESKDVISEIFSVNQTTKMLSPQNKTESKTNENLNNTVVTEPIVQPSYSQSSKVNFMNNTIKPVKETVATTEKPKDFRPSPQLETYYEFNKFPVVPVFPEAKTIQGHGGSFSKFPGTAPWLETSVKPVISNQEEEEYDQKVYKELQIVYNVELS